MSADAWKKDPQVRAAKNAVFAWAQDPRDLKKDVAGGVRFAEMIERYGAAVAEAVRRGSP